MRTAIVFSLPLVMSLGACTAPVGALPTQCEAIAVDETKELLVSDASLLVDDHVAFGRVMGAVLGVPPPQAAAAWVATPSAPSAGAASAFELIAIVNRVDLETEGHESAGEMRFVFGLVSAGAALPVTVNVELALPPTQTAPEWAATWHALGSLSGDAEAQALDAIADAVLSQPLHGQVRTQDGRDTPSLLQEFDVVGAGPLSPSPLFSEPAATADAAVGAWVGDNQSAVLADTFTLPMSMRARSIPAAPRTFDWSGVPADVSAAFSAATCSGCHTSEPTLDGAFHVSPLRRGHAAVSPFVSSPSGAPDELGRRAEILRGLLCPSI